MDEWALSSPLCTPLAPSLRENPFNDCLRYHIILIARRIALCALAECCTKQTAGATAVSQLSIAW
jgi:hypothetical protein